MNTQEQTTTEICLDFGKFFLAKSNAMDINIWIKTMQLGYNLLAGRDAVLGWLSNEGYLFRNTIISRIGECAMINPSFHDLMTVSTSLRDDKEYESIIITPKGFMVLTPKIVGHFYNKKMNELNAGAQSEIQGAL